MFSFHWSFETLPLYQDFKFRQALFLMFYCRQEGQAKIPRQCYIGYFHIDKSKNSLSVNTKYPIIANIINRRRTTLARPDNSANISLDNSLSDITHVVETTAVWYFINVQTKVIFSVLFNHKIIWSVIVHYSLFSTLLLYKGESVVKQSGFGILFFSQYIE